MDNFSCGSSITHAIVEPSDSVYIANHIVMYTCTYIYIYIYIYLCVIYIYTGIYIYTHPPNIDPENSQVFTGK